MNKLLNVDDVAEYLGVKKSTIYQWIHSNFIPHVKLGKLVRFREMDIQAWLSRKSIRVNRMFSK